MILKTIPSEIEKYDVAEQALSLLVPLCKHTREADATVRVGDGGMLCIPAQGQAVIAHTSDAEMNWAYAYGDVRETHC